jgi:hypothetical protein
LPGTEEVGETVPEKRVQPELPASRLMETGSPDDAVAAAV